MGEGAERKVKSRRWNEALFVALNGFTILFVAILLISFGWHVIRFYLHRHDSIYPAIASTITNNLATAMEMYRTEYGAYPRTTENRTLYLLFSGKTAGNENPRGIQFMAFTPRNISEKSEILDPWKVPYRFRYDALGPIITSAGPDRKFDTKDDIDNRKP